MLSVADILEAVIEKEKWSERVYEAAINKVRDPASRTMLERIVDDERAYLKMLEELKTAGAADFCPLKVEDPKVTEAVEFRDITESSMVQDILTFSAQRERLAAYAYSAIACDVPDPAVRRLFEFLSQEKLKRKHRIEDLYNEFVCAEPYCTTI